VLGVEHDMDVSDAIFGDGAAAGFVVNYSYPAYVVKCAGSGGSK